MRFAKGVLLAICLIFLPAEFTIQVQQNIILFHTKPSMSTSYRHLTINEREKIMILLAQGKKQAEIAVKH